MADNHTHRLHLKHDGPSHVLHTDAAAAAAAATVQVSSGAAAAAAVQFIVQEQQQHGFGGRLKNDCPCHFLVNVQIASTICLEK